MFSFLKKKALLNTEQQETVVAEIRSAEARTTGEIRVFVESHCVYMNPMDRATEVFLSLEMTKTERRNAILVYVALTDKQFALLGDQEIYHLAGGPDFWENAADLLKQYLKTGQVAEGLAACVHALGDVLATHFPYDPAIPKNQLPDEIVFGK